MTTRQPAPHWRRCAGADLDPEYVGGARTRHWWRCAVCGWVGWSTTVDDRPPLSLEHNVPR